MWGQVCDGVAHWKTDKSCDMWYLSCTVWYLSCTVKCVMLAGGCAEGGLCKA